MCALGSQSSFTAHRNASGLDHEKSEGGTTQSAFPRTGGKRPLLFGFSVGDVDRMLISI
jgi:hypothetical protein